MTTRTRYIAEYLYPGVFMPEETTRELREPTYDAAVLYGPEDTEGYFTRNGWYAVRIKTLVEERYLSDSQDAVWVPIKGDTKVESFIVGTEIHADDPSIADDKFHILRSNLQYNGKAPFEGVGVKTRAGNWQIRSDWDHVVAP